MKVEVFDFRVFNSANQIDGFEENLLILAKSHTEYDSYSMSMKTNLMKLTLFYQTFYKNIDYTRSNIGSIILDFSKYSPFLMNVPSFIKLIIVAGDGIILNGGGFTKHMFLLLNICWYMLSNNVQAL